MHDDIFARLRHTLESKLLLKYAGFSLGFFVLAAVSLSVAQSTFDPSLVNAAGEYVGNPVLLTLGILGVLVGVSMGFYYYGKWRTGSTVRRGEMTLEEERNRLAVEQLQSPTPLSPTLNTIQKLNTEGRMDDFYTSVVHHYLLQARQELDKQGRTAEQTLINDLASLGATHAYQSQRIATAESELIAQAIQLRLAAEKQGATTPSYTDFITRLRAI